MGISMQTIFLTRGKTMAGFSMKTKEFLCIIKVGSRMILLENSFPCDTELYRLMRLGFLQCISCCFFSENQVYYRYVNGRNKTENTDFPKGV